MKVLFKQVSLYILWPIAGLCHHPETIQDQYFDPLLGYAIIQRPCRISTSTHCWVMPSSRDHAGSVLWPIAGLCHHPETMQDQYFDPLLGYAIIQTPCRISTSTHCWVMPSSRHHAGSVLWPIAGLCHHPETMQDQSSCYNPLARSPGQVKLDSDKWKKFNETICLNK
jgi:hypothetical protein